MRDIHRRALKPLMAGISGNKLSMECNSMTFEMRESGWVI